MHYENDDKRGELNMYAYKQDKDFLYVKCEQCGEEFVFQKGKLTLLSTRYFPLKPFTCTCGNSVKFIDSKKPDNISAKTKTSQNNKPKQTDEKVRCPKCGSTQISANKKGFGLGKAAVGGALTGGVGLLGGFIGSNKVEITCLLCGKKWIAGKK